MGIISRWGRCPRYAGDAVTVAELNGVHIEERAHHVLGPRQYRRSGGLAFQYRPRPDEYPAVIARGSIKERGKTWTYIIPVGKYENGKTKYKWVDGFMKKFDVSKERKGVHTRVICDCPVTFLLCRTIYTQYTNALIHNKRETPEMLMFQGFFLACPGGFEPSTS